MHALRHDVEPDEAGPVEPKPESAYMTLPLIVLLPLLGSLVPLLGARAGRTGSACLTAILPLCALVLTLFLSVSVFDGQIIRYSLPWVPQLGLELAFRLDGLSLLFALLILGIGLLIIVYARYYLAPEDSMARFYSYLMLFMTSMLGIVTSDNLLLLWFFWELTSISSFLLISFWTHQSSARKGARMALAVTGAGGLCLLAGFMLIGKIVGTFDIGTILDSGDMIREHPAYMVVLVLVLIGAFSKSAQFPFQFWLPHAMSAPTPVSAYLHSATMVKAGIFLMIRLYPVISGTDAWYYIVTLVGLFTMFYGAYMAMVQYDLKGLLAYSTISHLGLITMLLGLDTRLSTLAAVFHVVNHAIFKASLFMAVGIVDHECGTRDSRKLGGLRKYMPFTAALATVAGASMAGVPLLNGFISKEMFLTESLQTQNLGGLSWLIPALATVGSALSVAYSLRLVVDVFYRGAPRFLPKEPHEAPRPMRLPIEVLILLCLAVGMFPAQIVGPLLDVAMSVVAPNAMDGQDLSLWHGFNLPLMMSIAAMVFGAVLYLLRGGLNSFRRDFLVTDAKYVFEGAVQRATAFCARALDRFDSRSLQRYVFLMMAMMLVLASFGLLRMPVLMGEVPMQPLDPYIIVGATLMGTGAIATVYFQRQRLIALICLSITELMVILTFLRFSAPDLALTQLVVSTVTVILMLLTLFFLPQQTPKASSGIRILRDLILAGAIGIVIASINFAVLTQPYETIGNFFTEQAKPGGGGYNVVNVILVDFRGFDTFGEIAVLGIAALGVLKLLNRMKIFVPTTSAENRPWSPEYYPTIFGSVSQVLFPLALMVSVYIFLRGHNLPGGGFIGGLVAASALIMLYMARGVEWTLRRLRVDYQHVIAAGLLVAAFTGMGAWAFGEPFLTSWFDYFHLPLIGELELATALLFDLGIYLVVIGSTMMILANLGKLATPHSPAREARKASTKSTTMEHH